MNQSQLVQSTKENDMSSCFSGSNNNTINNQGSSHLRRVANQRLSAMSNYEQTPNLNGGGGSTTNTNTRGSQQFMNPGVGVQSGSQMIRHQASKGGGSKARQLSNNNGNGTKDNIGGYNKSAEKNMTVVAKADNMKGYQGH